MESRPAGPAFEYVELVCMIVFTIDYVPRLSADASVKGRLPLK